MHIRVCTCVCTHAFRYLQRPEEGIGLPELELRAMMSIQLGFWDRNLDPLQKQKVFLAIEATLLPLTSLFYSRKLRWKETDWCQTQRQVPQAPHSKSHALVTKCQTACECDCDSKELSSTFAFGGSPQASCASEAGPLRILSPQKWSKPAVLKSLNRNSCFSLEFI